MNIPKREARITRENDEYEKRQSRRASVDARNRQLRAYEQRIGEEPDYGEQEFLANFLDDHGF